MDEDNGGQVKTKHVIPVTGDDHPEITNTEVVQPQNASYSSCVVCRDEWNPHMRKYSSRIYKILLCCTRNKHLHRGRQAISQCVNRICDLLLSRDFY